MCPDDEIGKRNRIRICRRKTCGFKSHSGYHCLNSSIVDLINYKVYSRTVNMEVIMSNSHAIDKNKIVLGQCVRVQNVEKKINPKARRFEADEYIAIQIEDYEGTEEICILLTHIEHTDMESVQLNKSMLDNMIAGRMYPVVLGKKTTYLVKVNHWDGRTRVLRMSYSQWTDAVYRADKHPKSCTKKSILTDLFD